MKIALRQRESLATLRVRDGVLVLEMMLWPDEIRKAAFESLDQKTELRPQELEMASTLIDALAGDFEPELYTDAYREALKSLIDAKVEGRELVAPPAAEERGVVVDLMAALEKSVEAARRQRTGNGNGASAHKAVAERPARRKSA